MAQNIWGINPKTGKPECFALRMPAEDVPELMKKAAEEGWTQLTIAPATDSWNDTETQETPS